MHGPKNYARALPVHTSTESPDTDGNVLQVEELSSRRQYLLPNTGYELNRGDGLALWELLPLARLDG